MQCLIGSQPVWTHVQQVMVQLVVVACLLLCHHLSKILAYVVSALRERFPSFKVSLCGLDGIALTEWHVDQTWNTLGNVYNIIFINLLSQCLKPFVLYYHPNGEMSVMAYPAVLAGSTDHWMQLTASVCMLLFTLVPFVARNLWATHVAGLRDLTTSKNSWVKKMAAGDHIL